MKCPYCGEDLELVVAHNADVIISVDPVTWKVTSAGLAVFDNRDFETGCCRMELQDDDLIDRLDAVEYTIIDNVAVDDGLPPVVRDGKVS